MVVVAQLVRALDCGSRGRRFETGLPPLTLHNLKGFTFTYISFCIFQKIITMNKL